MRDRATFGDFATLASGHLARALSLAESPAMRIAHVADFRRGLGHIVAVIECYLDDITTQPPARRQIRLLPASSSPAVAHARTQFNSVSAVLLADRDPTFAFGARRPASPVGECLHSAFVAMVAGRDLLKTHVALDRDDAPMAWTEWQQVMNSPPTRAALTFMLGRWAQLLEATGSHFVRASASAQMRGVGSRQELDDLRRLRTACDSLRRAAGYVSTAQRSQPVATTDLNLLYAIPLNAAPARRLLTGRETCAELRHGAMVSAERLRLAARSRAADPRWAPELTSVALRESAASATAISHHSSTLLRTIATRVSELGDAALAAGLTNSAEAAERARDNWLQAARSWNQFAAEGQAELSPVAVESADLGQWTKRLAYADGAWTLKQGPKRPIRSPEALAPTMDDAREVVAVAHNAAHSLSRMAFIGDQQIRQAAKAGRIYVPSRIPANGLDNVPSFMKAQPSRLDAVLEIYSAARKSSNDLADTIADNAAALGSASIVITATRAVTRRGKGPGRNGESSSGRSEPADNPSPSEAPGHFELLLSHLGQTDPEALKTAAEIDRLGEQLLVDTTRTARALDLVSDVKKAYMMAGRDERTLPGHEASQRHAGRSHGRPGSMEREAEL